MADFRSTRLCGLWWFRNMPFLTISVILLLTNAATASRDDNNTVRESSDDELYEYLFNSYRKETRPVRSPDDEILVKFQVHIDTIMGLNSVSQVLDLKAHITMIWTDHRLAWNVSEGRPRLLVVKPGAIWSPQLVLWNTIKDVVYDGRSTLNPSITHTGQITQTVATAFPIWCPVDIRKFPFDTQTCNAAFGVANSLLSNIVFDKNASLLVGFLSSEAISDWKTDGFLLRPYRSPQPVNGKVYRNMVLTMTLTRHVWFHLVSSVIPLVSLAFLNPIIFLLPVDHGERLAFSVSILLAFAVFLSNLSSLLPSTTANVCYVSIYSNCNMFSSGTISIFIILTARLASRPSCCPNNSIFASIYHLTCLKCSKTVLPVGTKAPNTKQDGEDQVTDFSGNHVDGREQGVIETGTSVTWRDIAVRFNWICFITSVFMNLISITFFVISIQSHMSATFPISDY